MIDLSDPETTINPETNTLLEQMLDAYDDVFTMTPRTQGFDSFINFQRFSRRTFLIWALFFIRIWKGQTSDDEVYHEVYINSGGKSKHMTRQTPITCKHELFIEADVGIDIKDKDFVGGIDGSVGLSKYIE